MRATIFLCGDVMTARGIDQILPHPNAPELHEPHVTDAREYVALAEAASGPIPRRVGPEYIWGDALAALEAAAPAARIVNLETSVTRSDAWWRTKGIHYRMSPENAACLAALRPDVCVLANNHVLDYGPSGLVDTLDSLQRLGIRTAGAGRTRAAARTPVAVDLDAVTRARVFACATEDSGVLEGWAATAERPGIDVLPDLTPATARALAERVIAGRQGGDVAIVSIHWGSNWGYQVDRLQTTFAHALIDHGTDIVYGHSSHHPRPIEIYRGRLVLYGCGDFLNDYEGIGGYESYRGDLTLMYFATVADDGRLAALRMVPLTMRKFRLNRTTPEDAAWMRGALDRASRPFGTRITLADDGSLGLELP